MSRKPIELTPAQKAEVETLAAVLTAEQIADYFGIGRTTFFRMVDRDPEIEERYKRGKAKAIGAIAQSLITKARAGDTTSMIFYLKTQAGWRETDRHEHVSATTIEVVDRFEGSAKLAAYIDGIAARQVACFGTGEDAQTTADPRGRAGGAD